MYLVAPAKGAFFIARIDSGNIVRNPEIDPLRPG
jgi:hypothetical protein